MKVVSRKIGLVDYEICWKAMQNFNGERKNVDLDEFWTVEHYSVYTLGKKMNLNQAFPKKGVPVVKTDRGGEITYHGRGQLILYTMLNIKRLGFGPREFVINLEKGVVGYLRSLGIYANGRRDAPGVYVKNKKIASLGLRFAKGFSYHGVALNVNMDLSPFESINPCGIKGLDMTQLSEYGAESDLDAISVGVRQYLYESLYPDTAVQEIPTDGFPVVN